MRYDTPASLDWTELDDLAVGTVIQRNDGLIAQLLPSGWHEPGCADPFDSGSHREWDGAHIISNPTSHVRALRHVLKDTERELREARRAVDQLKDALIAVAGHVVAGIDSGDTAALERIGRTILPRLGERAETTCPTCHGGGWVRSLDQSVVCPTCRESGGVHVADLRATLRVVA